MTHPNNPYHQLATFLTQRLKEQPQTPHTQAIQQLIAWTIAEDENNNPLNAEHTVKTERDHWMNLPEQILQFLALPYQQHPDYQDHWFTHYRPPAQPPDLEITINPNLTHFQHEAAQLAQISKEARKGKGSFGPEAHLGNQP